MKKTLLLTTALIGTLSILGTAQAEMKIGGHVKTSWKSIEGVGTARAASGFTQERQIDLSSSGTLNNGMKYAAGFSLEQDAGEVGIDGGEGNYVNVTMGNTTIELGVDHDPLNSDFNIVPRAGANMADEISGFQQYTQSLGTVKAGMGVNVQQKFTNGLVSVNVVPRQDNSIQNVAGQGGDTTVSTATGKSAYEISYFGQPVGGFDVYLNYANHEKDANLQNLKTQSAGFAYSMGGVKFGAELAQADHFDKTETETLEYAVTFKMSDNATAGIGHITTEGKTAAGANEAAKEKINYLQVGYNLGAIGTQLSYIDADNLKYAAASDQKALVLKINTKF